MNLKSYWITKYIIDEYLSDRKSWSSWHWISKSKDHASNFFTYDIFVKRLNQLQLIYYYSKSHCNNFFHYFHSLRKFLPNNYFTQVILVLVHLHLEISIIPAISHETRTGIYIIWRSGHVHYSWSTTFPTRRSQRDKKNLLPSGSSSRAHKSKRT